VGPVLQKVAEDLVLQRLPDLSGFPDQVIEAQLGPLFTKSGLTTDGILLLQELIRKTSYGLITMHTARPQDLKDFEPSQPFFADVQRIKGLFNDQLVVITSTPPYFELAEQAT